jgi:phosphotransferase system  glucose/maltose/N-acetylglucosamine-specific IIC component
MDDLGFALFHVQNFWICTVISLVYIPNMTFTFNNFNLPDKGKLGRLILLAKNDKKDMVSIL